MARSSAKAAITTILTVISFFLPGGLTHYRSPTTYIVGNEFGWDLSIPADTWASNKTYLRWGYSRYKLTYISLVYSLISQ